MLGKDHNLEDIIFMALKMEKNGEEFYKKLADKISDSKIKRTLNGLAQDEKRHGDDFLNIYKALKDKINDTHNVLIKKVPYLSEIVSNGVFAKTSVSEFMDRVKSESDCVDCAIECEDNSIRFYEELKKDIDEERAVAVDGLIREEREHKKYLESLKTVSLW